MILQKEAGMHMKEEQLKKIKQVCGTVFITVMLILTVFMVWSMKAESRTQAAMLFDNSMYEEKEAAYQQEVSSVLADYQCYRSGVMLTRELDLDGGRWYRLQIHDSRFALMDEAQKNELRLSLEKLQIQDYAGEALSVEIILTE